MSQHAEESGTLGRPIKNGLVDLKEEGFAENLPGKMGLKALACFLLLSVAVVSGDRVRHRHVQSLHTLVATSLNADEMKLMVTLMMGGPLTPEEIQATVQFATKVDAFSGEPKSCKATFMRRDLYGITPDHHIAAKACCMHIQANPTKTPEADVECTGKKKNTENAAAGAGAGEGGKGVVSDALLDSLSASCRMSVEKFLNIDPKPLGYVVM